MKVLDVDKLYQIAGSDSEKLEEELCDFAGQLSQNLELKGIFEAETLSSTDKMSLFKELYPQSSSLFRRLIGLLIKEKLFSKLNWLAEEFSKLAAQKSGRQSVEVISALTLTPKEREGLQAALGEKAHLRYRIDERIIGGLRLHWEEGRVFDASLEGFLKQMKEQILV